MPTETFTADTERVQVRSRLRWVDMLDASTRGRVLAGSQDVHVEAHAAIFASPAARVGVMRQGLARVYVVAVGGRQVTVAYRSEGELICNRALPFTDPTRVNLEAVTDCDIASLHPPTFYKAIRGDVSVALAVAAQLGGIVEDAYDWIATQAFGDLRSSISRHLLDRAKHDPERGCLVVRTTQADLAMEVGTVREVLARTLRDLRVEGIVGTAKGEVLILDPDRLTRLAGRWNLLPRPKKER
jgi:CRP/FNR family cyclic AMP-dependent transcriptional regulator